MAFLDPHYLLAQDAKHMFAGEAPVHLSRIRVGTRV